VNSLLLLYFTVSILPDNFGRLFHNYDLLSSIPVPIMSFFALLFAGFLLQFSQPYAIGPLEYNPFWQPPLCGTTGNLKTEKIQARVYVCLAE
jgi:hypothetical protein